MSKKPVLAIAVRRSPYGYHGLDPIEITSWVGNKYFGRHGDSATSGRKSDLLFTFPATIDALQALAIVRDCWQAHAPDREAVRTLRAQADDLERKTRATFEAACKARFAEATKPAPLAGVPLVLEDH